MDFTALYQPYWAAFSDYVNGRPGISPPLLLGCPEAYTQQPLKLFVIGQQTATWYNSDVLPLQYDDVSINKLVDIYLHQFRLGVGYRTPFWDAVRQLESRLVVASGQILWSNLNKVDENGARPSPNVERDVLRLFPTLQNEISMANPDVVVFFTGPYFDELLSLTFPGLKIERVSGHTDLLSLVRHPALPVRAFRTYHPQFLRRKRRTAEVLAAISGT